MFKFVIMFLWPAVDRVGSKGAPTVKWYIIHNHSRKNTLCIFCSVENDILMNSGKQSVRGHIWLPLVLWNYPSVPLRTAVLRLKNTYHLLEGTNLISPSTKGNVWSWSDVMVVGYMEREATEKKHACIYFQNNSPPRSYTCIHLQWLLPPNTRDQSTVWPIFYKYIVIWAFSRLCLGSNFGKNCVIYPPIFGFRIPLKNPI